MDDGERVALDLRTFYLSAQRLMDRMMKEKGTSYAQTRMLNFIAHRGDVRSTDMAEAFGHAPRTITEAIDGLERDGLVRRDPDPLDRRAKRVSITAAGRAAIACSEPSRRAFVEDLFGVLAPEEKTALSALLDKLNTRLEALYAAGSESGQKQQDDTGDQQRGAAR